MKTLSNLVQDVECIVINGLAKVTRTLVNPGSYKLYSFFSFLNEASNLL